MWCDHLVDTPPDCSTTGWAELRTEQTKSELSWQMDNRRVKELFAQDEDQEEDSIPLADDDPLDVLDESFISEERKRVTKTRSLVP